MFAMKKMSMPAGRIMQRRTIASGKGGASGNIMDETDKGICAFAGFCAFVPGMGTYMANQEPNAIQACCLTNFDPSRSTFQNLIADHNIIRLLTSPHPIAVLSRRAC